MKQRIFMYLFVFALLLIVFQYVNSKNILDSYRIKTEKKELQVETLKDSVQKLFDRNYDLSLFSITNNDDALTYFEDTTLKREDIEAFITDELYNTNTYLGEEHPLIPYNTTTDSKMIINQIRVVNHKWILANFTDGKFWGELFITYQIENGKVNFELKDYLLYVNSGY